LKTKLAKVRKDVVGARDEAIKRNEEVRAGTRVEEVLELKGVASRLRFKFPPMFTPLSRIITSGLATSPGHCGVFIAACMKKRKNTGPSHEPCRAPVVLLTSESSSQIWILALAPKWSRIKISTRWSGRPNLCSIA
jgi:hypothetical protein